MYSMCKSLVCISEKGNIQLQRAHAYACVIHVKVTRSVLLARLAKCCLVFSLRSSTRNTRMHPPCRTPKVGSLCWLRVLQGKLHFVHTVRCALSGCLSLTETKYVTKCVDNFLLHTLTKHQGLA